MKRRRKEERPPPPAATVPNLRPMTRNQGTYLAALRDKKCVVCTGPAGTGKTYLACWAGLELLRAGEVQRIILTRPTLECGERIGYRPGTTDEKIGGMMVPLLDALDEFLPPGELTRMRAAGEILLVPLGEMRGRTVKDSFIVLDEGQNATAAQLRMFFTRFGHRARMAVTGDPTQSDFPPGTPNALADAVARFQAAGLHPAVGVVQLTEADIVRDELVAWFESALTRDTKRRQK